MSYLLAFNITQHLTWPCIAWQCDVMHVTANNTVCELMWHKCFTLT